MKKNFYEQPSIFYLETFNDVLYSSGVGKFDSEEGDWVIDLTDGGIQ